MSVQLIVFPQYYDGSTPLSSPSTEFFVDGFNFNQANASSSTLNITGALPQAFINSYTISGSTFFITNTWYRYSSSANQVIEAGGGILFIPDTGILQRLSNLTFGATYDLTLSIASNSTNFTVYQYHNNILRSSHVITGTGTQTIQFDAYSTADTIVIHNTTSTTLIDNISCVLSTSTPSGVFTDLSNGQVICDLYEDEDIPLSLSVDDFKNVAEKVQSYSKAFNLPATKRNNQIFDNIFEVTRTDTGLNFNPYKKTKAILKQDGFLLFEGYLRLIDISDKEGEISYNVNLYSEVVALADVLGDRTFSDLDFTELTHNYNKTEIQRSWNDAGNSITYLNPSTSGFRDAYTTLRYPFVDWTHQYTFDSAGNPVLPNLESSFRPFINIKYLLDRIFEVVPFTYESEFFNTDDFKKLYMDFNWGADNAPVEIDGSSYLGMYWYSNGTGGVANVATTSFTNMILNSNIPLPLAIPPPNYDTSTHIITSTVVNETYDINYNYSIKNTDSSARTVECQWLYNSTPINNSGVITIAAGGTFTYTGNLTQIMTTVGDTLQVQFKASVGSVVRQEQNTSIWTADVIFQVGTTAINNNTILQTLRGELGQWDFVKGLLTMFNLVTLPDEDNPSNIKIEPYRDIFISSGDAANPNFFDVNSTELNWTEKIDISEMKLTPLTELNKKTLFKFVEDDDDYAFNKYKYDVGGHLYGSKKFDAWNEFNILDGEDEVVAEPFAATVIKPLEDIYSDFIIPAVYSYNPDDNTSEGFDNSPRIMYNNGEKTLTSCTYKIPAQNGVTGTAAKDEFLQFSHLSSIATATGTLDFHFGQCQLLQPVGASVPDNLFNLYWLPYYSELYNPDTRTMTIKVNLSPSDINTFNFYDTVMIKNRTYRVNKIDYKPNDLATVEFILLQ